ncbi:hypothetical protein [Acidisoma silvae]|uniref:hypothetical protein n=1 Tax=Acidisoma silvae TaxID=2802396 RepID=UPI001D0B5923|nr:hypothetical protein [Acidisoma silvae]
MAYRAPAIRGVIRANGRLDPCSGEGVGFLQQFKIGSRDQHDIHIILPDDIADMRDESLPRATLRHFAGLVIQTRRQDAAAHVAVLGVGDHEVGGSILSLPDAGDFAVKTVCQKPAPNHV